MKLKFKEKQLGQSWYRWFLEALTGAGFERSGAGKYEKNGVEVRVFKTDSTYQVCLDGNLTERLSFTFLYTTSVLYP